ncbi:MAG: type II secretion system F family protein [Thaumarchaeota archaeon]|nr:type II secretion system F family protein [Nitrososphaerota archaeon]
MNRVEALVPVNAELDIDLRALVVESGQPFRGKVVIRAGEALTVDGVKVLAKVSEAWEEDHWEKDSAGAIHTSLRRRVEQLYSGSAHVSDGFVTNPVIYVGKYVVYSAETGVITLPLSLILFYFTGEPLWFLANLVPLMLLAYPHLEVSSKLNTTTAGLENELPYFSVFASVMQSAGVSLYNAFERVVGSGIFKWMEQEGQLIQKERVFFGKTEGQALQERSRHIQSDRFRVFVQGYTSVLASGGDLASYLEGKVREFIQWSEFTWKKYASDSSDIGEVIISMFFVLPLLIVSVAFVYPEATMDVLGLMVLLVLPILTAAAWLVVDRAQPHTGDMVTGDIRVSVGAGAGVGIVTLLLQEPYWIVAAATIIVFTALYGWSTYFQIREVRQSEAALPQFLRDITEYKKIGYDITKAIQKLASDRSYNPAFDFVLIDTARQLELGARLKDVGLKTRSWFTRMAFKTLGEIVDSGGGTPELMELVTEFTQRISVAKKETKAQLRLYGILTYATPIGLALVIMLMQYMMTQFNGAVGGEGGVIFLTGFTTPPPIFLDLTKLLIVEASAMAALVASKAVDFTSKATLRIFSVTAVAVVSIVLSEYALTILGAISLV